MDEQLFIYKNSIYVEQPRHTVIVDEVYKDGVSYAIVKTPNYTAHIILGILICIVCCLILQADRLQQKVIYSTNLHCRDNVLQLNMINDAENSYDVEVKIYNAKEVLVEGLKLAPGQSVGNVNVNTTAKSGTSGMYTLRYTIDCNLKNIVEYYDVLIMFE